MSGPNKSCRQYLDTFKISLYLKQNPGDCNLEIVVRSLVFFNKVGQDYDDCLILQSLQPRSSVGIIHSSGDSGAMSLYMYL